MVTQRWSVSVFQMKSRSVHLKKSLWAFSTWEIVRMLRHMERFFFFILHPIRGDWNGRMMMMMMMGHERHCLASKPWSSVPNWTCHLLAPPCGYGVTVQLVCGAVISCFHALSKALVNYTVQRTSLKTSVLIIKRSLRSACYEVFFIIQICVIQDD